MVNEEYGNPCIAVGQVPGDFKAINFTEQSLTVTDKLYMAHLRNLAAETEKAYTRLSNAFGGVSDIDDNGSVDLFLSPDMNRSHFNGLPSDKIDSFRATLTYRPNDLAPFDSQRIPPATRLRLSILGPRFSGYLYLAFWQVLTLDKVL